MSRTGLPAASSREVCAEEETPRSLTRRFAREWRFKLSLGLTLAALFCFPYFLLEYHPLFPSRTLPLSWLDRAAGFHPMWIWPYQSIYLLINALPWLATSREQLRRYTVGFGALCAVGFAVFLLFPVRAPRPAVERATGMFRLLLLYDRPLNALPSLHAGLLVYTLAFGRRVVGRALPWKVWLALLAWSGVILYATLATKQHYAVDLVAGAVLAAGCDALAWFSRDRSMAGEARGREEPVPLMPVPRRPQ
jgi:membrane-associated phospholipid phosphatase